MEESRTFANYLVTKGESRRRSSRGRPSGEKGRKDGRIKKQRTPVDLLVFLDCNTRQFFWDVQAPTEELLSSVVDVRREKEALEGE